MRTHLFLYGPSGSGKTTIGAKLAEALGLPFYDLDTLIEQRSGKHIPEIFTDSGEEYFRLLEGEALREVLQQPAGVVALGGGALLDPAVRKLAETYGKVLCLRADVSNLLERLQQQPDTRPLLGTLSEIRENIEKLLAARAVHYTSFAEQFDTSDQTVAELVWKAQIHFGVFQVSGMADPYRVQVETNSVTTLGKLLSWQTTRSPIAIVSDENVAPFYLDSVSNSLENAGYIVRQICIPAGEESKSVPLLEYLWTEFLAAGLERSSTVLALGGGVVGDLSGMAAATYMRGIAWVNLPTSLLAMVDSSLGGKTGINLAQGKNLVGAFHPPRIVLSDPAVLASLPLREQRNGAAEIIKHGVLHDPELFTECAYGWQHITGQWEKIIKRAIAVKVRMIEADPYEKGIRATLNFGHTLGHALEKGSHFQLRHGEAVAIGMVLETRLAEFLGIARAGLAQEISQVLLDCGLRVSIPTGMDRVQLLTDMQFDKKKKDGEVRFAFPLEIGSTQWGVTVPEEALKWMVNN